MNTFLKVWIILFCVSFCQISFASDLDIWPGELSFPDDIRFRPHDKGEHVVYDGVSVFHMRQEIVVGDEDLETIRKTLDLAALHNAMVLIEKSIFLKNSVQIPIISVDPKTLRFVKVNLSNESWLYWTMSIVTKNPTSVEVWSGDAFIGTTCYDCSDASLDEHIEHFETIVQQAIADGLESIEINLTKDSREILVRDSEFTFYDPNKIGIQPFYFSDEPDVPGGFSIFEFQKEPLPSDARQAGLDILADSIDGAFLDGANVFFHPTQPTPETIQISYLRYTQLNAQQVRVKGVAVVDGFKSFKPLGRKPTIFQYSEVIRTFSRVLAKAIAENRRVAVNLVDRRGAMQMLMSVE